MVIVLSVKQQNVFTLKKFFYLTHILFYDNFLLFISLSSLWGSWQKCCGYLKITNSFPFAIKGNQWEDNMCEVNQRAALATTSREAAVLATPTATETVASAGTEAVFANRFQPTTSIDLTVRPVQVRGRRVGCVSCKTYTTSTSNQLQI